MRTDELRDQALITHNGLLITSLTVLDLALQDGDSVGFIPVSAGS
jgi:molybdopterin converting factor small subunit